MMAEAVQLQPVSRRTVADEVRDRLEAAIVEGRFAPGEPLPAERTLCADLGVARTSVREALRSLHALGYLTRQGNRAFVADPLPLVVGVADSRKTAVRDLFETRRLIEVGMVRLSAERSSKKQRQQMVRIAERFKASLGITAFRKLDREFHWAIASSCGNEMVAELYGRVLDALFSADEFDSLLSDSRNNSEVSRIIESSAEAHRAIACAIGAGDPERAAAEMSRHLDEVERRMIEGLV
jgi:GntR family transcriptional repressor for pyruvate dehydrogenase complex